MKKKVIFLFSLIICLIANMLPTAVRAEDFVFGENLAAGEVDQQTSAKWVDYQNGIAEITYDVIGKSSQEPIDVVMMLDNSVSMINGQPIPYLEVQNVGSKFVDSILAGNSDSNIALIPFSDELNDGTKKTVWDYYEVPVLDDGSVNANSILWLGYLDMDEKGNIIQNDENDKRFAEATTYTQSMYPGEVLSYASMKKRTTVTESKLVNFTNDGVMLNNTLNALVPNGNTNYEKPIVKATEWLSNKKIANNGRKKYIVMLSDGVFTTGGSGINKMNALKDKFGNDLAVYTIGLNLSTKDASAEMTLKQLASTNADGQNLYFDVTSTKLSSIYNEIAGEIQLAGTNGILTSELNDNFNYYTDELYQPNVNGVIANSGIFNEKAGHLTWNIGDITESKKTLKFYVKVKNTDGSSTKEGLLSDIQNSISLLNEDGQYAAEKSSNLVYTKVVDDKNWVSNEIAPAKLSITTGTIAMTAYLSDREGNYLNANGEITTIENAAILKTEIIDKAVLGYEYLITPQNELIVEGNEYIGINNLVTQIIVDEDNLNHQVSYLYADKNAKFTVIFQDADNNILKTELVAYGDDATAPKISKDGYTFIGWDKEFTNVKHDLLITSIFEKQEEVVPPLTPENPDVPAIPITPENPDVPAMPTTPVADVTIIAPAIVNNTLPTPVMNTVPQLDNAVTPQINETEQIAQNETPLANEKVDKEETPLAKGDASNVGWALINLFCVIVSVFFGIIILIGKCYKEKTTSNEDDMDTEPMTFKRRRWTKVFALIVAVLSLVVFILTEDMTQPILLIDKYTIVMVIIALIQIVTLLIARKWKDEDPKENTELA